ncbi:MAG: S-layer protein domain-containing protein [Methanobacteriota archaeon]
MPRIFVSHGSNHKARDELADFLRELGFYPVIAEKEPSQSRAPGEKIRRLIESSIGAVVLATRDEETSEGWKPRQNLIHEIGLLEERLPYKFVVLKEEGAILPSNVNVTYIPFLQGHVADSFIGLLRELKSILEAPPEPSKNSGKDTEAFEEIHKIPQVPSQPTSGTYAIPPPPRAVLSGVGGGRITTINPRVYDERKQPPIGSLQLPSYEWNDQNFEGFFHDLNEYTGTEQLTIMHIDGRIIKQNNLIYTTQGQGKTLNVVKYAFRDDYLAAANAGLEKFGAGDMSENEGRYTIVGWLASKYIAIKGKHCMLSKILVEHGPADKVILTVGETWYIGGGWSLTANAIDAKASPRQVWLTLSKDGVKKDDKVITAGTSEAKPIYTYVEKGLCGEIDVPVFVTYVDSVFAGATTDMVQLRYTWLMSSTCTEIKSGDKYGIMKVAQQNPLLLKNSDDTVTLFPDSTISIMGNLKFKVANDSSFLRFHPTILQ